MERTLAVDRQEGKAYIVLRQETGMKQLDCAWQSLSET